MSRKSAQLIWFLKITPPPCFLLFFGPKMCWRGNFDNYRGGGVRNPVNYGPKQSDNYTRLRKRERGIVVHDWKTWRDRDWEKAEEEVEKKKKLIIIILIIIIIQIVWNNVVLLVVAKVLFVTMMLVRMIVVRVIIREMREVAVSKMVMNMMLDRKTAVRWLSMSNMIVTIIILANFCFGIERWWLRL